MLDMEGGVKGTCVRPLVFDIVSSLRSNRGCVVGIKRRRKSKKGGGMHVTGAIEKLASLAAGVVTMDSIHIPNVYELSLWWCAGHSK